MVTFTIAGILLIWGGIALKRSRRQSKARGAQAVACLLVGSGVLVFGIGVYTVLVGPVGQYFFS